MLRYLRVWLRVIYLRQCVEFWIRGYVLEEEFCSERSDENGTVTRAKRSRPSIQNENAIVPTPSKTQMVPMTQKSQAIVKKVKTEPETPVNFAHFLNQTS